jgi:hypothetical protein
MTLGGRGRLALVGAAATVLGLGCAGTRAASPAPATPTTIKTNPLPAKVGPASMEVAAPEIADDDTRAAGVLAEVMLHHPEEGFRVLTVGSDGVGVARGPYKFLIQPRIQGVGQTNRFVIKQFYEVRPEEARHADKLEELCFEINSTMTFVRASLLHTSSRTLFVLTSELTFGDSISLGDLGTYLAELKHETLTQGGRRMAAYLK